MSALFSLLDPLGAVAARAREAGTYLGEVGAGDLKNEPASRPTRRRYRMRGLPR